MSEELWRRAPRTVADSPAVLVVDDDPTVLDTLALQLGREYRVVTANGGHEALTLLDEADTFAAVVSDMRMPDMDGITLLGRIRLTHPDTTTMLHTGRGDLDSAVSAINDGQVFRFLRKPCPTRELRDAVREAVDRHRLAIAERDVLDKTLRTSMQALFGCLELANPQAYSRAGRIRDLVSALCRRLGLGNVWEIEVAAMASQLGAITLPPAVLEKLDRGLPLPPDEQRMVDAIPHVGVRLLQDVPMLDDVRSIVRALGAGSAPSPTDPRSTLVTVAVGVIQAAVGFESCTSRGMTPQGAVAVLERVRGVGAELLAALREVTAAASGGPPARAYRLDELRHGMRIVEDVRALNGLVLIGRGVLVTEMLLDRLANYPHKRQIVGPVVATVPPEQPVGP